MPPKGPITWDDFTARLDAIYWPAFAPEARHTSRPNPPPDEPVVPDDIWKAALIVFPDPESWLHNPVPKLNGKTPIQALGRGQADEVRGCIMGVADFFLPDPSEVVPWAELEEAERAYEEEQLRLEAEGEALPAVGSAASEPGEGEPR